MIKFLADENFDNNVIRGVWLRNSDVDIIRVQDIGLYSAGDERVLEEAAKGGRILLTHDIKTVTAFAHARVRVGLPMPGVVEVAKDLSLGAIIEDILLMFEISSTKDWDGQVVYMPLR